MAKKKILLVDDDEGTLDMLELFLYKDYDVVTAFNGYEALSKAEADPPDVIMTDITMPEMDGIRFFNRISKIESVSGVPVIAVTSFGNDNSRRSSLINMGFYAVVPKPFERKAIISVAAQAANKERGEGSAATAKDDGKK